MGVVNPLEVPCPKCKAEAGKVCRGLRSGLKRYHHADRIVAARFIASADQYTRDHGRRQPRGG